jgi:hypothetical protein
MTDLQVAQPVFTLVLHSMFPLRATTLPAIVVGTFTLVAQQPSDRRKNRSRQEIRADESNDAA